MSIPLPIVEFSPEQHQLWARVVELWDLSKVRDASRIRSALHPRYVGWDMTATLPHDRDEAVRSITDNTPELRDYELLPLSVQVYEGQVGVVHYAYSARLVPEGKPPVNVTGRWNEVYLKQQGTWTMISVSGLPEVMPTA